MQLCESPETVSGRCRCRNRIFAMSRPRLR
ncbi:hypothetical protein G3480_01670, partial [Thiorhodococcus mannitoliphagus]|nr:hypothetical protein [Thiorhodococcus mannitoliphagus]